jgi:hypothetical protein
MGSAVDTAMILTGEPALTTWGAIQIWVVSPCTQSEARAAWQSKQLRTSIEQQIDFFTTHSPVEWLPLQQLHQSREAGEKRKG